MKVSHVNMFSPQKCINGIWVKGIIGTLFSRSTFKIGVQGISFALNNVLTLYLAEISAILDTKYSKSSFNSLAAYMLARPLTEY